MSTTASTITILIALFALMGIQTVWIIRSLDRIHSQLDWLSQKIVSEHGERIARLEEKVSS